MNLLKMAGASDCHSHVFGPFAEFPLAAERTFEPQESSIEMLEDLWKASGIQRAVLVQGSAHGGDHRALLAAIARDPLRRRGVALLQSDVEPCVLTELHCKGIRAVRFNWIPHLLLKDKRTEAERLAAAAQLLERVAVLGWHTELHLDVADLALVTRLDVPAGMQVVIDHMARLDVTSPHLAENVTALLHLLERGNFWLKLSGADRLTAQVEDLGAGLATIRTIVGAAAERCVWGLDWPHVNLARKRPDAELIEALLDAVGDQQTLEQVLVRNPETLYGFAPVDR